MWEYLQAKAPEIIVMVVIFGGFGWLFPRVQNIENQQFAVKEQVKSNEKRLERIAKASEAYGIRVAEVEISRPVELAAFIVDLNKMINKPEYASIVISLRTKNQLVFRSSDYRKVSIAHALSLNHIEGKCDVYTPKLSYLDDLCRMQGHNLLVDDSIIKQKAVISRLSLIEIVDEIEKDWKSFHSGSYKVSYDASFLEKEKNRGCDIEWFWMALNKQKLSELIEKSIKISEKK